MEDENSWFTITPTLEHRKRSAVFGPKDVTPVSRRVFGRAEDSRIYTQAQLSEVWDKILISAASKKALKKFSREPIVRNTAIHGREQYFYYAPRTHFYVDNMISPSYFKNQFMDTFGSVANDLEFYEIYFSCFLFIKLIVNLIVMIFKHIEIHRLTGASLGFGKTLLIVSYNLFLTSFQTSVFNPQASLLQALEPEPTSTRIDTETKDSIVENKKKEEHLYTNNRHPTLALSPVCLG